MSLLNGKIFVIVSSNEDEDYDTARKLYVSRNEHRENVGALSHIHACKMKYRVKYNRRKPST